MRIRVREQPTGRRLFRVCAAASLAAAVGGGLFLLAGWAAAGFDPQAGRELGTIAVLMVALLGAGVLLHYPWGPRWAGANGCQPDDGGGRAVS